MAQFYGTLQGARGQASRLGNKQSGLNVSAASWSGRISVRLWHDSDAGVDRFAVSQGQHHGAGIDEMLTQGIVGEPVAAG